MNEDGNVGMAEAGGEDWRDDARRDLEKAADRLLAGTSRGPRVYTERALARKIRLERARLPEAEVTAMPQPAADYLVRRQLELVAQQAGLTRLQAAVLALAVEGLGAVEIAREFGISHYAVQRQLRIARRRIAAAHSPYDGLFEVYWHEVHRCVYHKRRVKVISDFRLKIANC